MFSLSFVGAYIVLGLAVFVCSLLGAALLRWASRRGYASLLVSVVLAVVVLFVGWALGREWGRTPGGHWVGLALGVALCLYAIPEARRASRRNRLQAIVDEPGELTAAQERFLQREQARGGAQKHAEDRKGRQARARG